MNHLTADAVIIGGGASGMLCSAVAAQRGLNVILLEPNNTLGRKLRITGKGRCNVTNNCEIRELLANIPGDGRFLYSALNRLSPRDTMEMFEHLGLELKTERGNRVFPVSDNANDVAETLIRYMKRSNVTVKHACAQHILTQDGHVSGVETDDGIIDCGCVCICTGGLSYPLTGSRGAGYRMAKELGHTVTKLRPSLVPLECEEDYCAEMQGFSLRNVRLNAYEDGKLIFSELGEMLFTHFGISGPLIISASSYYVKKNYNDKVTLEIDLKPALTEEQLDKRILRDFEDNQNKSFKNGIAGLLPSRMIPIVIELCGIDSERPVHSITREERLKLINILKHLRVTVNGTRPFSEAIVTQGGISIKDVNPSTMESKLIEGLYITGELLDLDALTGGFNLQIAWSTGWAAGMEEI